MEKNKEYFYDCLKNFLLYVEVICHDYQFDKNLLKGFEESLDKCILMTQGTFVFTYNDCFSFRMSTDKEQLQQESELYGGYEYQINHNNKIEDVWCLCDDCTGTNIHIVYEKDFMHTMMDDIDNDYYEIYKRKQVLPKLYGEFKRRVINKLNISAKQFQKLIAYTEYNYVRFDYYKFEEDKEKFVDDFCKRKEIEANPFQKDNLKVCV